MSLFHVKFPLPPHMTTTTSVRQYMRWYHLFALLWVSQFVLACQDVTIAGAVAQWYFTR